MVLHRLYDDELAHASYLVGCPGVGEACVIDPNRDIDQYRALAANQGLRITAVTETHIHADFLSGSRELAQATGATLYLSDEGDADWKYGFAGDKNVKLIKGGDSFRIGAVRFDVVKTAGHTPEHVSFVITDEAAGSTPLGVFTGDFVFVGDVGRPDLLESAADISGTMDPSARALYASLKEFAMQPDHLLLWPAHGAGSACGKSLGGVPVSSLGYERATNWAFSVSDESAFVTEVLAGQPEPPSYFAEMKRLNKLGPAILGGMPTPVRLQELQPGGLIVDVRPSSAFGRGHIPWSLHLPLAEKFTNWAGWLVPYDVDVSIVAENQAQANTAARRMAMIGLDRVAGWYGPEVLDSAGALATVIDVKAGELDSEFLLDVRSTSEWYEGHAPSAHHIPIGHLSRRADEIPRDRRIAVHCRGGGRSPIAVAVLQRLGFEDVVNVSDGYLGLVAAKKG